jgi:exonuclease VII small subunit
MREDMPKMGDVLTISRDLLDKHRPKLKAKKRASLLHDVEEATRKDLKKLEGVVTRYRKVMKKLEDARNKLQNLREEQRAYIQNVASSIKSYGSFSSFGANTDVFGNESAVSLDFIKTNIASRLAVVKEFGSNLKKLLKMGYSKAIYDMVIQLGPEQGNEYAKALLAATPAEVKELNQSVGEINSMAQEIAKAAGSEMFDAGIKAAEGLVKGLEKKKKELERVAANLGKLIAQAIRKELGIKSPSAVGKAIGANFGGSIARGMNEQKKAVERASTVLARAAQFDPDSISGSSKPFPSVVGAAGTPGGTPGKTIYQQVDVHTAEIDPRRHAAALGWELAERS